MITRVVLLAVLFGVLYAHIPHYNKEQITKTVGDLHIMYGSTVRLRGVASGHQ